MNSNHFSFGFICKELEHGKTYEYKITVTDISLTDESNIEFYAKFSDLLAHDRTRKCKLID